MTGLLAREPPGVKVLATSRNLEHGFRRLSSRFVGVDLVGMFQTGQPAVDSYYEIIGETG